MYIRRNNTEPIITEDTLLVACDPILPSDPDQPLDVNSTPKVSLSSTELPTVVINEKSMIFRMDSRTLWTKYSLGLVNYAVSSVANLSTTPSVEERLTKSASLLGDYFIPYYGIRAGSEISRLLTAIFETGVDVVEAVKKKEDIVPLQIKWAEQTKELAELFNKLNPGQYPVSLIQEMLDALTKLWTDNIKARFTSNIILNAESIDGINKLVITGIANHVNKGYQSLADVLSRGVIAQYPLLFI
jgi:hypothetical protein